MADPDAPDTTPRRRPRGRPVGGGNTSEQARVVLMDAAERSILQRGFQASTMELIAREAGYSRAAMYRQFPSRQHLLEALVARKTHRHQTEIVGRLPENANLAELLVEGLVIVATELVHDPLLQTLSEQTDEGTVAHLVASAARLPELVEQLFEAMNDGETGPVFRPGLRPGDAGQFLVTTSLSMLLGVIPGIDDPETARRYVQTFVLPAILADPPAPREVFGR
ncbi:TetR/AcrR family transcriptional regulator; helix-turn-helix transcriptional regulator [Mycobacterium sp. SMC-8]|uniref:TetR/AcrR family transcriptional regulator n=1 Tax=Mycobacterium sp. SMC-8 TaxID=2857060 RepID=UPI0021B41F8D|nr:TetR/AcrR family transcriptional regulator [Mycobacterium sp. SMC-8]UXA13980.1 TetR/AcrR family transcriptional regulator; helix-turn-helix transcriptional regulator [Mycobacterium sp. SMC-8]